MWDFGMIFNRVRVCVDPPISFWWGSQSINGRTEFPADTSERKEPTAGWMATMRDEGSSSIDFLLDLRVHCAGDGPADWTGRSGGGHRTSNRRNAKWMSSTEKCTQRVSDRVSNWPTSSSSVFFVRTHTHTLHSFPVLEFHSQQASHPCPARLRSAESGRYIAFEGVPRRGLGGVGWMVGGGESKHVATKAPRQEAASTLARARCTVIIFVCGGPWIARRGSHVDASDADVGARRVAERCTPGSPVLQNWTTRLISQMRCQSIAILKVTEMISHRQGRLAMTMMQPLSSLSSLFIFAAVAVVAVGLVGVDRYCALSAVAPQPSSEFTRIFVRTEWFDLIRLQLQHGFSVDATESEGARFNGVGGTGLLFSRLRWSFDVLALIESILTERRADWDPQVQSLASLSIALASLCMLDHGWRSRWADTGRPIYSFDHIKGAQRGGFGMSQPSRW